MAEPRDNTNEGEGEAPRVIELALRVWANGDDAESHRLLEEELADPAALAQYVAFASDSVALEKMVGGPRAGGAADLADAAPTGASAGAAIAESGGWAGPPGSVNGATGGRDLARGKASRHETRKIGSAPSALHRWRGYFATAALASAATLLLMLPLGQRAADQRTKSSAQLSADRTGRSSTGNEGAEATPRAAEYGATLTGAVDCRWFSGAEPTPYGKPILLGQRLQLEAGYAQVTFDDGAKVIVQGPADFRIDSSGQGTLNFGKLTALVPRRAVGFRIETPTTDVVDLGTEFAVGVERSGKTEVHVKSGEVVVWEREPPAGRQSAAAKAGVHLYTEEAAKIGRSQVVSRLEARPSEFVWQIAPRLAPHERPSLPVVDSLALWMAADVLVSVDADGRVVAWRDIIAGDNQTEEDAMQPDELNRPRLVQDAIGGRSAVRFDGESSFLVTPPLESTAAQTLHFVLKRSYAEHKFGVMRQLINYNGPPYALDKSRDIRVLQIDDSEEPGVLWSRFFAGATSSGGVVTQIFNVGSVSTRRRVSPDVPIVLSYRYDPDANATTLWVNGRVEGVDGAPHWKSYTSRKVLGRHPRQDSFFRGDVAEVLIYNAALGDADNRRVIGYLSQRYDIACDSSE